MKNMESLEAGDFRRKIKKLSRNELQELCRACDLTPHKNKHNLRNSLISYFKVKGTKVLQECSIRNYTHLSSKKRETSSPELSIEHIISLEKSNDTLVTEIQLSDMPRSLPQSSESLPNDAIKSNNVPSFEFSVRSDEGIRLVVDLNSRPADWPKKLQNGICVCNRFWKGKLQSFCEEQQSLEKCDKSKDGCSGSLPNTLDKNGDAVIICPAANESLTLSLSKQCTVAVDAPAKESEEFPPNANVEVETTDIDKQDGYYKLNLLVDVSTRVLNDPTVLLSANCASKETGRISQEKVAVVSSFPKNHEKSNVDSVPTVKSRRGAAKATKSTAEKERSVSGNQEASGKVGRKSLCARGRKRKKRDSDSEEDDYSPPDGRRLRTRKKTREQQGQRSSKRGVSKVSAA